MRAGLYHPGYIGYLPWWEILNEVDAEHSTSVGAVSHDSNRTTTCYVDGHSVVFSIQVQDYTARFDAIALAIHAVSSSSRHAG